MAFKDHFSMQAGQYTQFRPHYPREVFGFLASLPRARDCAWDCGTGNGQAAVDLAEYFACVVATDPSAKQIAHAEEHVGVEYVVCSAEQCPLPTASIDLVTVALAIHWFDFDSFYAQVRRVGRAGSVLAVWCYGLANITPEVDQVVWHLYSDLLGSYWPPERKLIEERYETIPFPFEEIHPPEFNMTAQWSLDEFLGYLGTWSSVQKFIERHHENPLNSVFDKLSQVWGSRNMKRQVHWPVYMRVGRIG